MNVCVYIATGEYKCSSPPLNNINEMFGIYNNTCSACIQSTRECNILCIKNFRGLECVKCTMKPYKC